MRFVIYTTNLRTYTGRANSCTIIVVALTLLCQGWWESYYACALLPGWSISGEPRFRPDNSGRAPPGAQLLWQRWQGRENQCQSLGHGRLKSVTCYPGLPTSGGKNNTGSKGEARMHNPHPDTPQGLGINQNCYCYNSGSGGVLNNSPENRVIYWQLQVINVVLVIAWKCEWSRYNSLLIAISVCR